MTVFGLTPQGFVAKSFADIRAGFEARQRAQIDANINTSASSLVGNFNAIYGDEAAELWELAQAVFDSQDPAAATDEAQDAVCEITGTFREDVKKSTVTLTLNLNAGVFVPAGSIVSVLGSPTKRFVTLVDVTNSGGAPANVQVATEAETAGPVVANAGTLTVIVSAVTGWNTVTNAADAVLGANVETSSDLRIRREEELDALGTSPNEAIRADILRDVKNVTACYVAQNVDDITDIHGVPPHSVEAIVVGGADADIAKQIWLSTAGGIRTAGNTTVVVTDSQGYPQTIKFTRPTLVPIYQWIQVEGDGTATILSADVKAKAISVSHDPDDDVVSNRILSRVFALPGVFDARINISFAPIVAYDPLMHDTVLGIGLREAAFFDTANIETEIA